MTRISPFRFFLAMQLHAPYALVSLVLILFAALCMAASTPGTGVDDGVGMLLFVQMFLASSGFSERARRGHFDPLLAGRSGRTRALIAHWLISVLPGVLAWLTLALLAAAAGSPHAPSMVWGSRAAALFIVSAVAWVAGFAMPRGTAGFLWTAALLIVLLRRTDLVSSTSPLVLLFCPFGLLRMEAVDRAAAACAVLLALVALLAVWRSSSRLDIYLRERA